MHQASNPQGLTSRTGINTQCVTESLRTRTKAVDWQSPAQVSDFLRPNSPTVEAGTARAHLSGPRAGFFFFARCLGVLTRVRLPDWVGRAARVLSSNLPVAPTPGQASAGRVETQHAACQRGLCLFQQWRFIACPMT